MNAFDDQSLSDIEKDYFACAVAREDGNYIEQFLARYDYIVGKYSSGAYTIEDLDGNKQNITDFLDRDPPDPSGALGNYRPYVQNESPLTLTLWVVLGSGFIGLGAIWVAYWISKRKRYRTENVNRRLRFVLSFASFATKEIPLMFDKARIPYCHDLCNSDPCRYLPYWHPFS